MMMVVKSCTSRFFISSPRSPHASSKLSKFPQSLGRRQGLQRTDPLASELWNCGHFSSRRSCLLSCLVWLAGSYSPPDGQNTIINRRRDDEGPKRNPCLHHEAPKDLGAKRKALRAFPRPRQADGIHAASRWYLRAADDQPPELHYCGTFT